MNRLRSYFALFLLIIAAACAHQATRVATVPSPAHEVQGIRFVHTADQTDVVVEGLRPLIYTSFRLKDPDRFVVDIAEIGLGRFTERITPDRGLASAIQPRGGVSNRGSRFEIILEKATSASVRTDGTVLIVEIVRQTPRTAAVVPTPAPTPSAVRSVSPSAVPTATPVPVPPAPVASVAPVVPTPSPMPDSAPTSAPLTQAAPVAVASSVVPPPTAQPQDEDRPVVAKTASLESRPRYTGKKVSLDFQDADVVNVLRLIGDVSESNMVISDDVKGKVNLKLSGVPWDQALSIILKSNNLGQVREENIIRVGTLVNMTRQQDEELKAKETRDRVEDLGSRIITINYSNARALAEPLKKSLSPRGDITVDDRTNTLIVKDIEKNLVEVARLVGRLDTPTPQVTIEARIVQVLPSFSRGLGIQWGANYSDTYKANRAGIGGVTFARNTFGAPAPDFAVNLPASPAFGGVGISFGRLTSNPFNLDLRLSAGESQGLTRIVSRPKVTVLDNQEAKISQGEQIPFQTVSSLGTQTIFKDATLSLVVTPHISSDGGVMMKINITKDSLGSVAPGAPGPSILKKEASTNVLVRDGETTVIGGIYEKSQSDSEDGLPFLRKIPGLGWLFKTVQKREVVSELLVFLTPRVVKAPVTQE